MPGEDQGPETQFSGLARPGSLRAVSVLLFGLGGLGDRVPSPASEPDLRKEAFPFTTKLAKAENGRMTALVSLLPEALGRELTPSQEGGASGWHPFAVTAPHAAGGSSCHRDRCRCTHRGRRGRVIEPQPTPPPSFSAPAWPSVSGQAFCPHSQACGQALLESELVCLRGLLTLAWQGGVSQALVTQCWGRELGQLEPRGAALLGDGAGLAVV